MNRFMGLMPTSEIEKEVRFKDSSNLSIAIQAGPNGWTIIFADGSTNYTDQEKTTEENFKEAFELASECLGPLTKIDEVVYR